MKDREENTRAFWTLRSNSLVGEQEGAILHSERLSRSLARQAVRGATESCGYRGFRGHCRCELYVERELEEPWLRPGAEPTTSPLG